jgi:hypothetical protein
MEEKDNIRNEIQELAPGFPSKPTVVPPAGYFDQTPERILTRWSATQQQRHRRIALQRIVAVAAIVSGLVIGIFCWQQKPASSTPLHNISGADAYTYIHENIEEFSELLHDESIVLPTDEDIPGADAEQYLLDELDDEELEQLF